MTSNSDDDRLYPSFEDWLGSESGLSVFLDQTKLDAYKPDDFDTDILSIYASPEYADQAEIDGLSIPIIYNNNRFEITSGSQLIFLAILEGITYSEDEETNELFGNLIDLKSKLKTAFNDIVTHLLLEDYDKAVRLMIKHGVNTPFCCQGFDQDCIMTITYHNVKSGVTIPDRQAPRDKGTFLTKN